MLDGLRSPTRRHPRAPARWRCNPTSVPERPRPVDRPGRPRVRRETGERRRAGWRPRRRRGRPPGGGCLDGAGGRPPGRTASSAAASSTASASATPAASASTGARHDGRSLRASATVAGCGLGDRPSVGVRGRRRLRCGLRRARASAARVGLGSPASDGGVLGRAVLAGLAAAAASAVAAATGARLPSADSPSATVASAAGAGSALGSRSSSARRSARPGVLPPDRPGRRRAAATGAVPAAGLPPPCRSPRCRRCGASRRPGRVHDHAAAAAVLARLGEDLEQALADPLAGHLHQAERGDLGDLVLGAVAAQALGEPAQHEVAVALEHHVDEVDDDDAADVAQPELADDLLGRLHVVARDRLLEVAAGADELAGVDVDDGHRLGAVDDQRAARGQPHLAVERLHQLLVDAQVVEDVALAGVAGQPAGQLRGDVRDVGLDGVPRVVALDDELLEVLVEDVADDADRQVGLAVEQGRRVARSTRPSSG